MLVGIVAHFARIGVPTVRYLVDWSCKRTWMDEGESAIERNQYALAFRLTFLKKRFRESDERMLRGNSRANSSVVKMGKC